MSRTSTTQAVFRPAVLTLLAILLARGPADAAPWPTWRGPVGNSASPEIKLPLAWSKFLGIRWTTPVSAWGASSPIVWEESIFLTGQRDDALLVIKMTTAGQVAWMREIGKAATPPLPPAGATAEVVRNTPRYLPDHNLASPSPVTNGQVVAAHFGNGDLVALDYDGHELWKRNLQEDHGPFTLKHGRATSPVIFGNLVISACVQDARPGPGGRPAPSYLVAHDLESGRLVWHTNRTTGATGEDGDSYATPAIALSGETFQLIVSGGTQVDAYDPATGVQLWNLGKNVAGRTVASPTAAHGRVYVPLGEKGPTVAIELNVQGQRARDDYRWKIDEGTPGVASPAVWGDLLFLLSEEGMLRCFDADSGKQRWRQRIPGEFRASPVTADGRVYLLSTDGKCTVISAAARYDKLAVNVLDDEFYATPAVSDSRLYLRGKKAIYCIGKK